MGVLVEQLLWRRTDEGDWRWLWRRRLSARKSWAAAARKEGRGEANGVRGGVRAGAGDLKARPGAAWPARTEQRRRAAVAGDTRRANSAGVGH